MAKVRWKISTIIISLIGLFLLIGIRGVNSLRSGRYSSYRSSRSSYTYRSTYRSYRSYYSSNYYSSGSYYSSRYSYQPVRYYRSYASWSPSLYYYYYVNRYYYYSSTAYYSNRNVAESGVGVCKNYEANQNGTYLGVFQCPLPFEPVSFTYCCGDTNSEYCCSFGDSPGNVAGLVIGGLIFLGIVIGIIVCCVKCHSKPKRAVTPSIRTAPDIGMTHMSGQPPRRPSPQQAVGQSSYQQPPAGLSYNWKHPQTSQQGWSDYYGGWNQPPVGAPPPYSSSG